MSTQSITAADRIRELSAIDAEVAAMLQSAGRAIDSLTNRPLKTITDGNDDTQMAESDIQASLDDRKAAFKQHTEAYYIGLQSVTAQLKRQAYALEEAAIIASEAPALTVSSQQRQAAQTGNAGRAQPATGGVQEVERITNGGLGNLDVGWLNSRGNKVGAEKENELIKEAKMFLDDVLSQGSSAPRDEQIVP